MKIRQRQRWEQNQDFPTTPSFPLPFFHPYQDEDAHREHGGGDDDHDEDGDGDDGGGDGDFLFRIPFQTQHISFQTFLIGSF